MYINNHYNNTTSTLYSIITETKSYGSAGLNAKTVEAIQTYSIVLYTIVLSVCVISNTIVIVTIVRARKFHHTKNFFLLNIAVSDLLVGIICMPSSLLFHKLNSGGSSSSASSTISLLLCKTMPFLQGFTLTSSIYSFLVISIERYVSF